MGLLLDGNKQNHKNAQDHSANKFNKYQVIASIPEEHNLNLVAFGRILIIYVHVSQPEKFEIIFCRQLFILTTFYDSYTVLLWGPCIRTNNVVYHIFFYMYTKPSQSENSHVTGLSIGAGSQPKPPAS